MATISVDEYEKALHSLREAIDFAKSRTNDIEYKIARDAAIQRFEFCVELAWKTAVKKLGLTTAAPRPAIRDMAQNSYISNPNQWFDYVEARNKSSHTYVEDVAKKVYQTVLTFVDDGFALLKVLKSK